MSAQLAGQLEIQMMANLARLSQDMTQAKGIVSGAMRDMERAISGVQRLLSGGFVATSFTMVAKQAMESEQAINRLDAVIKATGNASGYAAKQLHGMADAMAEATQFDDEDIRNATASLLKFGNIHSETLKNALKISADYAAFTGTNMAAASEVLGKALSSPAQGIERLQRSIGYLNPAQVEAIKSMQEMGDISGAQAALMQILTDKIGGVAEAMNTGYTKAFGDAKKATGEFFETLGGTVAVQVPVQTFLRFVSDSMRDMKHIIEDGDWVQALKFIMGFRQTGEQAAARRPAGDTAANPAAAAAAELEERRKFAKELDEQDARFVAAAIKRQQEAEKERERLRELDDKGWVAYAQSVFDTADQLNTDLARLEEERSDTAFEMRQLEAEGQEWLAKNVIKIVEEENKLIEEIERRRVERSALDQAKIWNEIGDAAGNFFADLVMNGRSAFDNLKNSLKSFAAEIIALFAKRWILNMVAGGSAMGSAGSAIAGGVGSATSAGNALGMLGSAYSTGSLFASAYGAGMGAFGAGSLALTGTAGIGPVASGAAYGSMLAGTGASSGTMMSGVYTALANIPVWGWIAMAVIAAISFFSGRGGGPKEGGSFFGGYDSSGAFSGNLTVPGTDNGRFFTPTGGDSVARQVGDSVATSFFGMLQSLGGTAAGMQFGFGFDKDPSGTADSRVSAMVRGADGRTLLNSTITAGRDDADFERAVGLQTRRALLAGLQGSELPSMIADVLTSLSAATATAEQIDQIFSLAGAVSELINALAPMSSSDIIEQAGRTSTQLFRDQGDALMTLAGRTSMTVDSLGQLTQATNAYRQSAAQLILGLQAARQQIGDMFADTRRTIGMAGMDQQAQYNFLQNEAAQMLAQIGGSTSAEEITRLSGRINANINQAFQMLSPEQQVAMQQEWLTRIDTTNTATQDRLSALQEQAQARTNETLTRIEDIMTRVAASQAAAAQVQSDAAATQMEAARTPHEVRVDVNLGTGTALVTEGG